MQVIFYCIQFCFMKFYLIVFVFRSDVSEERTASILSVAKVI